MGAYFVQTSLGALHSSITGCTSFKHHWVHFAQVLDALRSNIIGCIFHMPLLRAYSDTLCRQKVKEQIAQDRADKAVRLQAEKQQQQQQQQQQSVPVPQQQTAAKREYDSCRLQVGTAGTYLLPIHTTYVHTYIRTCVHAYVYSIIQFLSIPVILCGYSFVDLACVSISKYALSWYSLFVCILWNCIVCFWFPLQIRCFGGQVLTQTFKPSDTLVDVNKYILMNRSGDNLLPYTLMTNFPKKTFSSDDMSKSLQELGKFVPKHI